MTGTQAVGSMTGCHTLYLSKVSMVTASAGSWVMVEAGPRQKAFLSGNEAPSLAQTPPKPHFAVLHGFRCFIGLLPSCCLISL